MDGLGYGNWGRTRSGKDLEDDSFDSSSPPTYTSDPYGFESNAGQGDRSKSFSFASSKKDAYDFNFGHEDDFSSSPTLSKPKVSRRLSTEDRMAEILKNNKNTVSSSNEKGESVDEEDIYGSWKNSWNQLMEGVETITSTSPVVGIKKSPEQSPPPGPAPARKKQSIAKSNALNTSDSFEIDESDFEVGTLAARRSQELLEERRRKSMAAVVGGSKNNSSLPQKKYSDSPDVHKKRDTKDTQKAHFSTAGISSIDPDENLGDRHSEAVDDKEIKKYGSMGKSDGDLLKVLEETKQSLRYPSNDSARTRGPDASYTFDTPSEIFSPTGPSPPSKRRQKQMENRLSLSPTPGKSSIKHQSKPNNMQNNDNTDNPRASKSNFYEDDDHTGDYSMDDFDEDSPEKAAQQSKRSVSVDNVPITDEPDSAPSLTKSKSAPVSKRVLTKEEEEAKRSMDEIVNRWSNMSSVGKLFPPVEEEIEKSIESRKSGQDEDEEKLAGPDTVTDSAIDNVNESEAPPPPKPEQSNDSTSLLSTTEQPPPPPSDDNIDNAEEQDTDIPSHSTTALAKFKAVGHAVIASNRLESLVKEEKVGMKAESSDFNPRKEFQSAVKKVIANNGNNNSNAVEFETTGEVDKEEETKNIASYDYSEKNHVASETRSEQEQQTNERQEFNRQQVPLAQNQHFPPPPMYYYCAAPTNSVPVPGHYNNMEHYPWQDPHHHVPPHVFHQQRFYAGNPGYSYDSNFAREEAVNPPSNAPNRPSPSQIALMKRPVGTEIDPNEFFQQAGQFGSKKSGAGHDTIKSLPFTSPSITELHAHIASLQSHTNATKNSFDSKSQVSKEVSLVKKKAQKKTSGQNSYSKTRISDSHVNGRNVLEAEGEDDEPPCISKKLRNFGAADGPKWSAINRIEAGNSRLLKQFEELDREIRSMKKKTSNNKNSDGKTKVPPRHDRPGSRAKRSNSASKSLERKQQSSQKVSNSIPDAGQSRSATFNVLYGAEIDANDVDEVPPPPPPSGPPDEDKNALDAIKAIFHESMDRERQMLKREESLEIRESLLSSAYNVSGDKVSVKDEIENNDKALIEEVNNLKAELYELRRSKRKGNALPSVDEACALEEKPQEDGNVQESIEAQTASGEKGDDGQLMIRISKEEYETLKKNNSELEKIAALYEKSNAQMATDLSGKDAEIKAMRVDFFNQQEALVRECNSLKNKLHSDAGASRKTSDSSRTSLNEANLRDVLQKDALLQDLHDQIVKLGHLNQKKDTEIQKLTDQINELKREAIVMGKTMEQYSSMAAKGKALVDAFYPESSSNSDHPPQAFDDQALLRSRSNFLHWNGSDEHESTNQQGDENAANAPHSRASLTEAAESDSPLVSQLRQELHSQQVKSFSTIASLRSRLQWYADNQALIEKVEAQKKELQIALELEKSKSSRQNDSFTSTKSKSSNRSQADVRRIKELESALVACREAIQKRFPDSVANLLYANVVGSINADGQTVAGDSKQNDQLKVALEEKEAYKRKAESAAQESEQRLRSLRQEFERMRINYENTIQKLNADAGLPPVPFSLDHQKKTADKGDTSQIQVRSFGEAKNRIQDLEVELEKVRSFYTKKMESSQRKHQAQISALRRGAAGQSFELQENEKKALLERISMLEDEVLRSAEEMGRLRAKSKVINTEESPQSHSQLSELQEQNSSLQSKVDHLCKDLESRDAKIKELEAKFQDASHSTSWTEHDKAEASQNAMENDVKKLEESLHSKEMEIENIKRENSSLKAKYDGAITKHSDEKENLHNQVLEMRSMIGDKDKDIQQLHGEVMKLKLASEREKTPQMQQFMAMESKVNHLETRLARREEELARVVEESKASGHLERLRLQSIHEQELREKDEQLLRFEGELTQLVAMLHQDQRIQ